jgi:hypothetical protein
MTWTIITSNTTLTANQKYLVDSSSGQLTLTFPISSQLGDEIIVADGNDFSQNPVTLQASSGFSNDDTSFILNGTGTQFQFIYDDSIWRIFNVSREGVKISELSEVAGSQISSDDLLLYINKNSGAFETNSITYGDLKNSINESTFTSVGQIVTALNTYTNADTVPRLNVTRFDGQAPAFYRNYNNLTNRPTIPTLVGQLTNDVGYISNLSAFTSDQLTQGNINLYLTQQNFDVFFGPAFAAAFRAVSSDIEENQVIDSKDNITASPSITNGATNVLNLTGGDAQVNASILEPGQAIRIFGATINLDIFAPPSKPGATKNGFGSSGGDTVRYRVAQFEFTSGKISAQSEPSDPVENVVFEGFNLDNNVSLSLSRISGSYGLLIYRQRNSGPYILIDILGQKQLGNTATSAIQYIDYGSFNTTIWSKKDLVFGNYTSNTNLIHFPIESPSLFRRGWIDAVVSSVDLETNQVTLNDSFYFNTNVIICQNDTQKIQSAINNRKNIGIKSLTLNDRRYFVSQLDIPTQFSFSGKGKSSVIKKLPWSSESDNRVFRTSDESLSNITLSNFTIDGNLQNQWLKNDITDEFANYAIDMKTNSDTLTLEKIRVKDVVGGGLAAKSPNSLSINLSRFENSGMSDLYEYSPLIADDGQDVIVTNNVFKNFTYAIDLSVTDNGVFSGNAVQNIGTGVLTFGSTFFISSQNILRGPAGEYIPGPDVLNSVFDAVNINLSPSTTFNSDVYKYQENGRNFDLTANEAFLTFRVDKLRKVNNVEELYGEVLTGANNDIIPIQRVEDVNIDATEGEFKFTISSATVNELLTTYSYSTLKAIDTNHVGLVYKSLLTEYVESGNIFGQEILSPNTQYRVTVKDFSNIFLGANVKFRNHGGTPDLNNRIGTIINISIPSATPPERIITIEYDEPITVAGEGGKITVENTFILAKGRIL